MAPRLACQAKTSPSGASITLEYVSPMVPFLPPFPARRGARAMKTILMYTKNRSLNQVRGASKRGASGMQLREAAGSPRGALQTAYAWVRQGTLPGPEAGRGYEVWTGTSSRLATAGGRQHATRRPRYGSATGSPGRPAARRDRCRAGDAGAARVERPARELPLIDVCERVIAPALRRIGSQWAAGELTIAQPSTGPAPSASG